LVIVNVPGTYEFVEAISARDAPLPEGCGVVVETGCTVGDDTGCGCGVGVLATVNAGVAEFAPPLHAASVAAAKIARTRTTDVVPITNPPKNGPEAERATKAEAALRAGSSLWHNGRTFQSR
jgi:hypothetical protein